jgi:fructose-1,6-bisphosphatase I
MYPRDTNNENGKLRFAFEAAPLGFIIKYAGGRASTGEQNILDIVPTEIHQRVPLYIGSTQDVNMAEKHLATPSDCKKSA